MTKYNNEVFKTCIQDLIEGSNILPLPDIAEGFSREILRVKQAKRCFVCVLLLYAKFEKTLFYRKIIQEDRIDVFSSKEFRAYNYRMTLLQIAILTEELLIIL